MKNVVLSFLVILFLTPVFSQIESEISEFEQYYESGKLPEIVIKKAGDEFSLYLPDSNNPDNRIVALQDSFISYNLGKDYKGHNSYLLLLEVDGGMLSAEFDNQGRLLSVVEKFTNAKLPEKVRVSLANKFPKWKLLKGRYLYVQKDGSVTRKEYKIIMKKDNKVRRVVVNENGEILRGKS